MITVKEIFSKKEFLSFVKFPFELYKGSKYWVPSFINEELALMDKKINPVYKNADAKFFLAYKNGKIVGRIAAMINWIEVKKIKKNKVRFGWYDVVDDIEVSKLLIEEVINYGKENKLNSSQPQTSRK